MGMAQLAGRMAIGVLALLAFSTGAQVWTPFDGPKTLDQESYARLYISGAHVFAQPTQDKLLWSADSGATWTNVTLLGYPTNWHPRFKRIARWGTSLFGWNPSDSVFVLNDGASQWVYASGVPLPPNPLWDCFNRGMDEIYTVAIGNAWFMKTKAPTAYYADINRSDNQGATWTKVGTSPGLSSLVACGQFLFEAGYDFIAKQNAVKVSSDSGRTWSTLQTGISDLPDPSGASLVSSGSILALGSRDLLNRSVLDVSKNNGTSWTRCTSLPANCSINSIAPIGNNIVLATTNGLLLSRDYGTTWSAVAGGLRTPAIAQVYTCMRTVLAVDVDSNIYSSSTEGAQWTPGGTGLPNAFPQGFAAVGDTLFFAMGDNGVYRSTDQGLNWTAANNGIPMPLTICELTSCGPNLFARFTGGSLATNLLVSADRGGSWTARSLTGISLGYRNLKHIEAFGSRLFGGAGTSNVFYSDAFGTSPWTGGASTAFGGSIYSFLSFAVFGDTLYASTSNNDGIHKSNNLGENMTALNTGLPSMTVSPFVQRGSNSLFVASADKVLALNKASQSWSAYGNLPASVKSVSRICATDNQLIAVTMNYSGQTEFYKTTLHSSVKPNGVASRFPVNPGQMRLTYQGESARLSYVMPLSGPITLRFWNTAGGELGTLSTGIRPAGTFVVTLPLRVEGFVVAEARKGRELVGRELLFAVQ